MACNVDYVCVLLLISGRLFNAAVGVPLIRALTLLNAAGESQAAHTADAGDVIMMLSLSVGYMTTLWWTLRGQEPARTDR